MTIMMNILGVCCLLVGAILTFLGATIIIGNFQFSAAIVFLFLGILLIVTNFIKTKDFVKRMEYRKIETRYVLLALFIAILIGSTIGFVITDTFKFRLTNTDGFKLFKDLLIVNITIITLLTTLFGGLTYIIVGTRLIRKADAFVEKIENIAAARSLSSISYIHWLHFEPLVPKEKNLDEAIALAQKAHNRCQAYVDESDVADIKGLRVICGIKNNLGYYLAARKKPTDCETALSCAKFLKENLHKFPERKGTWVDTIEFIERECGTSQGKAVSMNELQP